MALVRRFRRWWLQQGGGELARSPRGGDRLVWVWRQYRSMGGDALCVARPITPEMATRRGGLGHSTGPRRRDGTQKAHAGNKEREGCLAGPDWANKRRKRGGGPCGRIQKGKKGRRELGQWGKKRT